MAGIFAIRTSKGEGDAFPAIGGSEAFIFSSPLIFPTIGLVTLLAFLTSIILSLAGYQNPISFDEPFAISLILHALAPAVLEEILFRFIPLKLLGKEGASSSFAVIFTSLAFSLAHCNLFQIPYAAFAGAIFAFLYISTGSIIPSVAAHLLNNVISLLTIYYDADIWVYVSLSIAALLSVIIVILRRSIYKKRVIELFSKKVDFTATATTAVFAAVCIMLSILNLSRS